MKLYKEWAEREYSLRQRLLAFIPEGVFFLFLLPVALILLAGAADRWLSLPRFTAGWGNIVAAIVFFLIGLFLAMWAIVTQVTSGRGTPVPLMPTTQLVARGPFAYCRNPMTLGTIIAYLGFGILLGSWSALALVLLGGASLLVYIKLIEEKELETRFGPEYLEYKRSTPFLFPRLRHR